MTANAQFKEIKEAPFPPAIAHQKIGSLLENVAPDNRDQTVEKLSSWLAWYRDILDEELIARDVVILLQRERREEALRARAQLEVVGRARRMAGGRTLRGSVDPRHRIANDCRTADRYLCRKCTAACGESPRCERFESIARPVRDDGNGLGNHFAATEQSGQI